MIKWLKKRFKRKEKPIEGYTFIEMRDIFCATIAMYGAICLSDHDNDLGLIQSGAQYTYYFAWLKHNDPETAKTVAALIWLLIESAGDKESYSDEDIENAIEDVFPEGRWYTVKYVMSFYHEDVITRFNKIRW